MELYGYNVVNKYVTKVDAYQVVAIWNFRCKEMKHFKSVEGFSRVRQEIINNESLNEMIDEADAMAIAKIGGICSDAEIEREMIYILHLKPTAQTDLSNNLYWDKRINYDNSFR
jgi:hypothetical protein